MEHVGLDVSLKMTAICIVDRSGKIKREGVVASDPEAIAAFVRLHAPHVARIELETGATSAWLWTELNKMGLPVIWISATIEAPVGPHGLDHLSARFWRVRRPNSNRLVNRS
jgi:transposase